MGLDKDSLSISSRSRHPSYGTDKKNLLVRNGSLPILDSALVRGTAVGRRKYSLHQRLVFLNFLMVNFCSAMCISLQAPFYPAEAERKGATPSEYGFVFGVFELVVFIMSPFYGKYMRQIGPKFMMVGGIFVTSICCILFGFLDRTPAGTPFLALSFIIRIVAAIGEAGFITASNSIIVREFNDSVGTTFAFIKTSFGLGLITGPTVGGILYEIGGFTVPFMVLGGIMLISAGVTIFLLPAQEDDIETSSVTGHTTFLAAFRVPSVIIAGFAVSSTSITIGFTSAILEPHLRQFHLSPTLTGLMFIINGGVYAFTSPIWGRLCDTGWNPKLLSGLAAISMCIAFLFLGPAPFFPFGSLLWLTVVALVFQGIGIGGELVAAYVDALQEVIKYGFPDNLDTYGVLNGIWNSLFALGAFLGPSVGGILFDNVGFRMASMVVLVLHIIVAVLFLTCHCMETSRCRRPSRLFDVDKTLIPDTLDHEEESKILERKYLLHESTT